MARDPFDAVAVVAQIVDGVRLRGLHEHAVIATRRVAEIEGQVATLMSLFKDGCANRVIPPMRGFKGVVACAA